MTSGCANLYRVCKAGMQLRYRPPGDVLSATERRQSVLEREGLFDHKKSGQCTTESRTQLS